MSIMQRVVKPSTHKGKKYLQGREPKILEDIKQLLFLKGRKTSAIIQEALKDLYVIKSPDCHMLQKKNNIVPFEDVTGLENLANKRNCSLFFFGSQNKKRPNNLIIGRIYDRSLLDMVEFELVQYKGLKEFQSKITVGTKPCLVFAGQHWAQSAELTRLRTLLVDCFQREKVESIRLQGLEHVISFTATADGKVLLRSYCILLKKSGTKTPRIELEEIGPSMDLKIGRSKLASDDLYKIACRKPKALRPTVKRNISTNKLGTKHGRIHLGKQGLDKIQTRKMKGLKKTYTEKKLATKRKRQENLTPSTAKRSRIVAI